MGIGSIAFLVIVVLVLAGIGTWLYRRQPARPDNVPGTVTRGGRDYDLVFHDDEWGFWTDGTWVIYSMLVDGGYMGLWADEPPYVAPEPATYEPDVVHPEVIEYATSETEVAPDPVDSGGGWSDDGGSFDSGGDD